MNETTIQIVGNLTADPELRFTPAGKAVANLRVAAHPRRYNAQTRSWERGTPNYFDVDVWGPLAENTVESVRRGDRVVIFGQIHTDTWTVEGSDTERRRLKVTATEVGVSLLHATAKPQKSTRTAAAPQDEEAPF
jgi:single-strand DNA-binding protein